MRALTMTALLAIALGLGAACSASPEDAPAPPSAEDLPPCASEYREYRQVCRLPNGDLSPEALRLRNLEETP